MARPLVPFSSWGLGEKMLGFMWSYFILNDTAALSQVVDPFFCLLTEMSGYSDAQQSLQWFTVVLWPSRLAPSALLCTEWLFKLWKTNDTSIACHQSLSVVFSPSLSELGCFYLRRMKTCMHSSWLLVLFIRSLLYFKVECLSSVVRWSQGVTKLVITFPGPGPLQGDKWNLFLPSHAFWLMLNPFGLIILIAVPAIKTTDAFVQVWGLQNVTEGFWKQQSTFLKVDLWVIVNPPWLPLPAPFFSSTPTDCSRGQGHPTMQAGLLGRRIQGCVAGYHRERTVPFQWWVVKMFCLRPVFTGSYGCLECVLMCCKLCIQAGFSVCVCGVFFFFLVRVDQNTLDIFKQLTSV